MATLHRPQYTLGIVDQTGETMTHSYYSTDLTLLNFAAQEAALLAVKTAETALIAGAFWLETVEASRDIEDPLPIPANGVAQIEMNWLCLFQDSVTKRRFTLRIACPDLEDETLRLANSNFADLTNNDWQDYKTAVEAVTGSPEGNSVIFLAAKLVGKADLKTPAAFKGFI